MTSARCLLLAIAWLPALAANNSENPTAFLDRPLPADLKLDMLPDRGPYNKGPEVELPGVKVTSFPRGVALLEQLSGKKVVLPDGFGKWLTEHPQGNWGGWYGVQKKMKARELFERICMCLEVRWRYDPQRDAIVLSFGWQREDARPSSELVALLARERPVNWTTLKTDPQPNGVGGHGPLPDDWRIAFDALLSKPENLQTAGTVRAFHDLSQVDGFFGPVINLFASEVKDGDGPAALLILNGSMQITNKSAPGAVAYYLFSLDGEFLHGGVYSMGDGYVGCVLKATADRPGEITIDVGWGSFAMSPTHVRFSVVNQDLVLQGSTDSKGGVLDAADTRAKVPMAGYGTGLLKYSVAGVSR